MLNVLYRTSHPKAHAGGRAGMASVGGFSLTKLHGGKSGSSAARAVDSNNQEDEVLAVLLAQMIEDRTIRFEVFPGKTSPQVNSFTEKAVKYHR